MPRMLRRLTAPELNARKQYCKHGHPLFGDNLRLDNNGRGGKQRVCRACEYERSKTKHRSPEYLAKRAETLKRKRAEAKENKIQEAAKVIAERRAANLNR